MLDNLLRYYERELSAIRHLGQDFAEAYPKVAGRLLLEAGKCEDPHVERLIEAVAFLAARVHQKIDDQFPEISSALLETLYPQYLATIPSMSVVQFHLDPEQGKLTSGYRIAPGTVLYSAAIDGVQCRFRTCYPLTLWPVSLAAAKFEPAEPAPGSKAVAMLTLELRTAAGVSFHELEIDQLRFYLHGESQLVHAVYDLLVAHVREIRLRPGGKSGKRPASLPPDSLQPVGFAKDEGMLPYPSHALLGYRLLQEYFTFPQKFLFVDLTRLHALRSFGPADRMEIHILLDDAPRPDHVVAASTFRLGCTAIVNIFEQMAEPIGIDQTQLDYRIIPDIRRQHAHEVYAIQEVNLTTGGHELPRPVQPLYSVHHPSDLAETAAFWCISRRPSEKTGDHGTEVYLSLVDGNVDLARPAGDVLTVRTLCTNRDLPVRLRVEDEGGEFELEGAAPVAKIDTLLKPTAPVRPSLRGEEQWRLLSHLSLNYLSLDGGPDGLQEILRLYDFSRSTVVQQQIAGIVNVTTRRVVRRPTVMDWHGFCRGMEVTLECNEDLYVGSSALLFASVLEQFLALYASLNSFTQVVVRSHHRKRVIKQWPPRTGEQTLL